MTTATAYKENPSRYSLALGAPVVLGAAAALSVLGLLLSGDRGTLQPQLLTGLGITVLFLAVWVSRAIDRSIAAIIFFLGAVGLAAFPAEIVFSGFYALETWTLLGVLMLGYAARESGLADRLGQVVVRRSPMGFAGLVWSIVVLSAVLTFLVPSPVLRAFLVLPVAVAIAETAGFVPGSRGRSGLLLAAALASTLPGAAVLPASLSGLALSGTAAGLYGVSFGYGQYLAANFPVLGIGSFVLIAVLVTVMFADTPTSAPRARTIREPGSGQSTLAITVLVAVMILWMSDWVHLIHPAWVVLVGCLVWLAAKTARNDRQTVSYADLGLWLSYAAILGLAAVVNHAGLGAAVGAEFVETTGIVAGEDEANFAKLTGLGILGSLFATVSVAPALTTTAAQTLASATGWPLETVLLAQVPTWIFFVFPFQAPILMAVLAAGKVPLRGTVRLLAALTAAGFLVLGPLHFLWLQMLGYI